MLLQNCMRHVGPPEDIAKVERLVGGSLSPINSGAAMTSVLDRMQVSLIWAWMWTKLSLLPWWLPQQQACLPWASP